VPPGGGLCPDKPHSPKAPDYGLLVHEKVCQMNDQRLHVFTIGYATHTLAEFVSLLKRHGVNAVADVRSQPYGRVLEFGREALALAMKTRGIEYVFLGRELGARRDEMECYVNGQAVYKRVAELPVFQEGLACLARNAAKYNIAVMCAEKDPIDCHRTVLICRHLRKLGFSIQHILADGSLEEHESTEKRLVERTGLMATLFDHSLPFAERVERAYEARGKEIAYRRDPEGEPL